MRRQVVLALLFLALSTSVLAAAPSCSIRPAKDTLPPALQNLAKVSQVDAQKAALAKFKASSTKIKSIELEVEQGCLVYSFDIAVFGKRGIEEIMVDAGTGKLLSHKHESATQEAAEQAKDRATLRK
jgi:hypothetical protein